MLSDSKELFDSKELADYWFDKVEVKGHFLLRSTNHVPTQKLRHECTNYDELWKSDEVAKLDKLERSHIILVIKYQCTARVLERRAGHLRRQVEKLDSLCEELQQKKRKQDTFIKGLQKILFGESKKVEELIWRIYTLENEISQLKLEAENIETEKERAYDELSIEFYKLRRQCQSLVKKNQSLGGKLAHTKRYKRERDEARAKAEQQENQINALLEELYKLRQ